MKKLRIDKKIICALMVVTSLGITEACGTEEVAGSTENSADFIEDSGRESSIAGDTKDEESESAADGTIDFTSLKEINPDIFGWIYIPQENIDRPILQNVEEEDDYYSKHNENGEADESGAVYTEFPNATDFCDFNEVIYGIDSEKLLKYKDPDYFQNNRTIEIFTDKDHMTYQVVMARDWEKADLLTQYAFSLGVDCENFLRDAKTTASLSDNIAPEFDDITFRDFLITLVAEKEDKEKQFIVIGRLIKSDNGTIKERQLGIPGVEF